MGKKNNESATRPTLARVIANDGSRAVLELVDGFCLTLRRGYSTGYELMFSDEFQEVLHVGRRIDATIIDEDRFTLARASDIKFMASLNSGVR